MTTATKRAALTERQLTIIAKQIRLLRGKESKITADFTANDADLLPMLRGVTSFGSKQCGWLVKPQFEGTKAMIGIAPTIDVLSGVLNSLGVEHNFADKWIDIVPNEGVRSDLATFHAVMRAAKSGAYNHGWFTTEEDEQKFAEFWVANFYKNADAPKSLGIALSVAGDKALGFMFSEFANSKISAGEIVHGILNLESLDNVTDNFYAHLLTQIGGEEAAE